MLPNITKRVLEEIIPDKLGFYFDTDLFPVLFETNSMRKIVKKTVTERKNDYICIGDAVMVSNVAETEGRHQHHLE